MQIDIWIFNWPNQTARACKIEQQLHNQGFTCHVINSDPEYTPNHWLNVGNSAWFAQQWHLACALFRGDVMFHIQADAEYQDWANIIHSARETFALHNWGLYSPNLQHNNWGAVPIPAWTSNIANLHAVANPDCTCWFIHKDIVEQWKNLDLKPQDNYLGWGIDCVVSALSWQSQRVVLRDWRHTVYHHPGRGYQDQEAVDLMYKMFAKLPPELYNIVVMEFETPHKLLDCLTS